MVLVIDTDPAQCDLICTVIREKLEYRTIAAANGTAAIRQMRDGSTPKPDLILFDATSLPEPCELIAHLRILVGNLPIVTLVKYGDHAMARLTVAAGAQDFLHKPVGVERLRTTLRNMLSLRDARRETECLRHLSWNSEEGGPPPHHLPLLDEEGNILTFEKLETEIIRFAMQHYDNRLTEVARRLRIGRSTLYRKLSEITVRKKAA
jgi:DNA-binding NtrC family response regulator